MGTVRTDEFRKDAVRIGLPPETWSTDQVTANALHHGKSREAQQ